MRSLTVLVLKGIKSAGFYYLSKTCIYIGDTIIKRGFEILLLTGLIPPHLCACSKPETGFHEHMYSTYHDHCCVFYKIHVYEVRGTYSYSY